MSNIMNTRCPSCSHRGAHPVVKTSSKFYYWDDRSDRRLKEQFGKNLLYRSRTRKCIKCGTEYKTCELPQETLSHIMQLWKGDEHQVNERKKTTHALVDRNDRLAAHFETFLKRRGSGSITSLNQDVGMLWMELGHDVIHALKEGGILTFQDILLSPKSELIQKGKLTEAQWQKVAKLFASSGLTLEDDTPSVAA
jgi:DNA-directed RNA polymerase subunit RPC12/RpoP